MVPLHDLLEDAETFVRNLYERKVDPSFAFHNIEHTVSVVQAAGQMADHYRLEEEDRAALLLAAWFHDTGYSSGKAADHESLSISIAGEFMEEYDIEPVIREKAEGCIRATRMPQDPASLIEKILCDADLYHLGTDEFREQAGRLLDELRLTENTGYSKKEWRRKNIEFLQEHRYFTDYAREKLEPVKQENLNRLLGKEKNKDKEKPAKETSAADKKDKGDRDEQPAGAGSGKKDPDKENRTERGIATMFRIMSANHMNLSQMADSKANIMISVNTIVLSILVSVLLGKLPYYPQYIIPTVMLTLVCLSAIVFAILSTRPTVNVGRFSREDIVEKKVNLLFFGNFFNMDLPDYDWAMKEMMNDRSYLYGSMIKDIYFLGRVLARKYRFLRYSYNVFMFGLIVSVLAFGIAFMVSGF